MADENIESDPLLVDIPARLEGPRILLRPLAPGEGSSLYEAVEESRSLLDPWQTWPRFHETPLHSELAIRRAAVAFAQRQILSYGIFSRSHARFLGRVQLEDIDWRGHRFGLGYWLRASATGCGYATEGASILCRTAFEQFDALRVEILTDSTNERSIAVARRLGFALEGRLRNERLNSRGEPQDTLVFGRTTSEHSADRAD